MIVGDLKVIFKMWCHISHDFILYLAKVQFIINCLMAVFSKKKTTNNIIHNLLRDIFVTKTLEGVANLICWRPISCIVLSSYGIYNVNEYSNYCLKGFIILFLFRDTPYIICYIFNSKMEICNFVGIVFSVTYL